MLKIQLIVERIPIGFMGDGYFVLSLRFFGFCDFSNVITFNEPEENTFFVITLL
jgi:hypothetical protein